ncbi:MAG: hypothetical protein JXR58_10445 [Bacteroidales bacterium]|nr:hypothetical protein [Bacteroidales bacterium]
MEIQLLNLHLSQLINAWSKSKLNIYSDIDKKEYHNNLNSLLHNLINEDFSKINPVEKKEIKSIIDFLFKSLEFLDNSTLNSTPFEIVQCLKAALKVWTDEDNYIIVTSLNNNLLSFSFDETLAFNEDIYHIIKNKYKIEFKKRLIQINLPQNLSKDYLANVVLYHELGHFIDLKYRISETLTHLILFNATKLEKREKLDIIKFFPYITEADFEGDIKKNSLMLSYHLGEYFSDIFAAQFIDDCSNHYLKYITENSTQFSFSHPSTVNRIALVELFMNNKFDGFVINNLISATNHITGKQIEKQFEKINGADLIKLLPIEIENDKQLHSLFIIGWQIWLSEVSEFKKTNDMQFELPPSGAYQIINNLIEKSISNYFVKIGWNKAKSDVSS